MQMGRGHEESSGEELAMKPNATIRRRTRRARWAVLIAGALASTGTACNLTAVATKGDTTDPSDTTEPTETAPAGSCLYADCPTQLCMPYLYVDRYILERCYGWDKDNQVWATSAPEAIKDCDKQDLDVSTNYCQCDDRSTSTTDATGLCKFSIPSVDVFADASCSLGNPGELVTDQESACTYNDEVVDTSALDTIAKGVNTTCLVANEPPVEADPNCFPVTLGNVKRTSNECPIGSCDGSAAARTARPPGTNVTLSLDPARSYLAVTTPLQSVMVRLSGEAFVDLPGNRLLGLKVSAERIRFGSSDWNGFSFSLDNPVPFARVGEAFRIPVAQKPTITATGRRDGALTRLRASSASDVTGHLSVAHKTWDLDFADQSVAGSFALHLVGRTVQ